MDARPHERGREIRPRLLIAGALAATVAAFAPATGAAGAARATTPTTGRLLVTLKHSSRAHASAAAIAARTGARVAAPSIPRLGVLVLRPRPGASPHAVAARLRRLPGVQSVQAEHRFSLRYEPNDPALTTPEATPGTPAGVPVEWWALRENLPAMWDVSRGDDAVVAVIDTGADGSHPELSDRIIGAVDNDPTPGDGPATVDEVGHGTHVASLACAAGDDGVSLVGAGLGCKLLIYKTDLSSSSVARSITAAVDAGADAINMSFGTDGSAPADDAVVAAIDDAFERGVPLVGAAADEPVQEQGDPANVLQPSGTGPFLDEGKGLSVTAADALDERASFAGRGSQISLAAYGAFLPSGLGGPRGIFGAFPAATADLERPSLAGPGCACRTSFGGDGRYAYIQGTSMAAPMVTAVAAVIHHLNPDLGAGDINRILKVTARRPAGRWTPDLGWGILDGGAAIAAAKKFDRTPPVSHLTVPRSVVEPGRMTLRWTDRDPTLPGVVASGVRKVEVWRATDDGRGRRIASTTRHSLVVHTAPGARYRFWTIAVDRAGNRELPPDHADARVRVAR